MSEMKKINYRRERESNFRSIDLRDNPAFPLNLLHLPEVNSMSDGKN